MISYVYYEAQIGLSVVWDSNLVLRGVRTSKSNALVIKPYIAFKSVFAAVVVLRIWISSLRLRGAYFFPEILLFLRFRE